MTNARITGRSEAAIVEAFERAGATQCRVLGNDWLTLQIRERPRLRMMVPRLYGLGDLSQIIDERAYDQAKYVLSAMGDDLRCFVITDAHRKSVRAITRHGFVLLLGDPASGKSTIGASLAIGALDNGSTGTIKVSSPEDFVKHWNPREPKQFFWVDDAFGPTQYQPTLADGWNRQLPLLVAALKNGARVLLTSRNYIWEAAKRDLKLAQFPLFNHSKVVINVQNLSETERAQILYNHMRLGDQPRAVRSSLKPFLADVARSKGFLPETARRLGSRFFTSALDLSLRGVIDFTEHPVEFLNDVLRNLTPSAQSAIALIFLTGTTGVVSPLQRTEPLKTVMRLYGVSEAAVARALQDLDGSLTLLVQNPKGLHWIYKHPTIADAFAGLVGDSPELIEIYIQGAKLDRLFTEVVCGSVDIEGAKVRVPQNLYPRLVRRMRQHTLSWSMDSFLTWRADSELRKLFLTNENLEALVDRMSSELSYDPPANLLAKIAQDGCLPAEIREAAANKIEDLTISMVDTAAFSDDDVRSLLTAEELAALTSRFESEVADRIDEVASDREWGLSDGDKASQMGELVESLRKFAQYRERTQDDVSSTLLRGIRRIEERIYELELEAPEADRQTMTSSPVARSVDAVSAIFDDVDH